MRSERATSGGNAGPGKPGRRGHMSPYGGAGQQEQKPSRRRSQRPLLRRQDVQPSMARVSTLHPGGLHPLTGVQHLLTPSATRATWAGKFDRAAGPMRACRRTSQPRCHGSRYAQPHSSAPVDLMHELEQEVLAAYPAPPSEAPAATVYEITFCPPGAAVTSEETTRTKPRRRAGLLRRRRAPCRGSRPLAASWRRR